MARKILLIEPNYKNKYPPMGLMKIATYHRMLGDEVSFYKGNQTDFALNETMKLAIQTLYNNDDSIRWNDYWDDISSFFKTGSSKILEFLCNLDTNPLVKKSLESYRRYFRNKKYLENPQWDRICITTLFTFYWTATVDAINYYKQFCKDPNQVFVGGIAASVVPDELEKETGIKPIVGLLDKGGELDANNDIIIDTLPLDYSILEEIDYVYPEHDGYYGYMTRGCVNKCAFCVVPKLEPGYQSYISIKDKIQETRKRFGEKRNLLLLDNNVLASKDFNKIIKEIKASGFKKGATYIAPNSYKIAINNVKDNYNVPAYKKSLKKQYDLLLSKTQNIEEKKEIIDIMDLYDLDDIHTMNVDNILAVDKFFSPKFERLYKNKPKERYVDFNQGIDSRLINDRNIKKLSEIPIRPLRIAFDHWELRDVYENSVRLAAKHGITHLSNYLLYNFMDKPLELFYRMKMNVELCEELGISIYSFPMKYHPIQDPQYFRERTYLGKYWNRKFIRSVQAILNSTKGKIGRGKSFFEEAFGADENGFWERMYMPEAMIIYRFYYKENGVEPQWWEDFNNLPDGKKRQLKKIVEANEFNNIKSLTSDDDILSVLQYYTITRDDFESKAR